MKSTTTTAFPDLQLVPLLAELHGDLLTPLASIDGYTELLLIGAVGTLNHDQQEEIEGIRDAARAIKPILDDVLDMARVAQEAPMLWREGVRVGQLVHEVVENRRAQARADSVLLSSEVLAETDNLRGDGVRLRDALGFLVDHAVARSPAGGQVQVHVQAAALRRGNGYLVDGVPALEIQVQDGGPPIPEPERAGLFQPLAPLDDMLAGRGRNQVDFPLVYALVDAHGGRLTLESGEEGTAFALCLPLEKLPSLNRRLLEIAEELTGPLITVVGYAELLLEGVDGPLNDRQRAQVRAIHLFGARLLSLVDFLLDVARLERGELGLGRAPFDIGEVIQQAIADAQPLVAGKPVQLLGEIDPDLPPAYGDIFRTQQVLKDLLANALAFTQQGGIIIRATRSSDARQASPMLMVSVIDSGCGIPAAEIPHIFEPLVQVAKTRRLAVARLGLGLALAPPVIRLQGGRIWAESLAGAGAVFSFTVPAQVG
jgi:signal transduction histidine kinase